MASTTMTIRLDDAEREFFTRVANFEGVKLSTFFKEKAWEACEDFVDARAAERGHRRYEKHPEEFVPFEKYYAELRRR